MTNCYGRNENICTFRLLLAKKKNELCRVKIYILSELSDINYGIFKIFQLLKYRNLRKINVPNDNLVSKQTMLHDLGHFG